MAAILLAGADAKKVTRVTVLKTDKSSTAGELIDATPVGVLVKASAKTEAVLVPWAEIKTVSNGLTRQKVIDDWRTTHVDALCETCHGDGTEKCVTCKGTGVDPEKATPCEKCKGTGSLGKCAKCKDGKAVCPNTCIKESDFAGQKKDETGSRRSRNFRNNDGSGMWFHEAHIGELMVKENGTWQNKGKCPTCGGTTQVVCPACHGTATRECPSCHGAGVTGPACTAGCAAGRTPCKTCDGTGLKAGGATKAG